ncbi:hypothetical protein UA45_12370 [Morganella morganii]|uniref:Uncharacterized protein n=1 Tax=Morganella morganii TaxID=582 RepID=A0A0D8L6J6_MORMO|nr:hypothetical protein UA45_12370 [Morganella morganii]
MRDLRRRQKDGLRKRRLAENTGDAGFMSSCTKIIGLRGKNRQSICDAARLCGVSVRIVIHTDCEFVAKIELMMNTEV